MPFGLRNAPAVFQRLMDLVLSGLTWESCMVFFDDVIVFSRSWEEHLRHLDEVFTRMVAAGMTLNFKKCEFAQSELVYLGYLVNKDGVRPNPRKVKAVLDMPVPRTVTQLRTVLGVTNYFRKFIKNYAAVARPLTDLLTKGTGRRKDSTDLTKVWTDKQQAALDALKRSLTDEAFLAFPDMQKEFVLWCDASDDAMGAVLMQTGDDGNARPVEFASRVLSKREVGYSVTEREALAIVFAVRHFRHYLHGVRFKLVTDHNAVTWMVKQDDPKGRVARWVVSLQEFDYTVVHRPGSVNVIADAMSRAVEIPEGREGVDDFKEDLPHPLDTLNINRVMPGAQKSRRVSQSQAVLDALADKAERAELTRQPMDISNDEWRVAQMAEPMLKAMRLWLTSRKLSTETSEWNDWVVIADKDFEIVDDILCRRVRVQLGSQTNFRLVPVVPKLFQTRIVCRAHTVDCAHAGENRTFDWIRRRFWWSGFYTQVRKFVRECTCCQAVANPKGVSVIEGRITPKCEFDILGMDLVKLPKSVEGSRHVLVVMDHFTRFAWAHPVKRKSAAEVMNAFLKTNVPTSRPRILLSDNGPEFKNALMDSYCKAMGITQHFCIPYRPQSDGTVERFNGSLIGMLRCYSDESGGNWERFLPKVVDAYNSMVHPTTGAAPFVAMFKLESTSQDFWMPTARDVVAPTEFDQLREWIRAHVREVQARSDASHNVSRTVKRVHNIGDLVWLRDFTLLKRAKGGPGKLARQWSGPWTVTQTWGGVVLTIKRVGGSETKLAHADQVKRFLVSNATPREARCKREPTRPTAAEQAQMAGVDSNSDSDEDNAKVLPDDLDNVEFDVEAILGHFRSPHGFWFLVKWSGFVQPTWEHESLLNAPKLVTSYFKSVCESDT